jgi:signal transduction histidine kinase/DNA-binding response OmpR family regulator
MTLLRRWYLCGLLCLIPLTHQGQMLRLPADAVYLDTAIDLREVARAWVPAPESFDRRPWQGDPPPFTQPADWKALFDGQDRPRRLWLRLDLDARHLSNAPTWLIAWNAYETTLFFPRQGGQWDSLHSGNFVPAHQRPLDLAYGAIAFLPLPIIPGQTQTVYFRIKPGQVRVHERLEWAHAQLMTPAHYLNYDRQRRSLDSLLLGLIMAIALYHLILFFSIQRQEYLFFSLYGLALALFMMNLKDYTLGAFWPQFPRWNYTGFTMSVGFLVFFTFVRFTRHFLQLPRFAPRRTKVIDGLLALNLLFILLRMGLEVAAPALHAQYHPLLAQGMRLHWTLIALLTFWAAIGSYAHLPTLTRRYLLTNSLLIVATLLRLLSSSGLLPVDLPFDGIAVAVVMQQLLFALTLAAHIHQINQDKQASQRQAQADKAQADQLAALDQAKSRLFTDLTHEFRSPLTIISGLSDELHQQAQLRHGERLGMIHRQAEQLNRLVSQLLDLAKLDAQQMPLHLQHGDVVPLLRYATEMFQPLAADQSLRLQCYSDVDQLLMDHDAQRLQQVVANLVSNAIKYTPADGKVSVLLRQAGPESLEVTVADTGIGLSAAELPRVFDRFFQGGQAAPRHSLGTGVGLALVQELVKLMKGTITVESTQGQGTRFRVRLPITHQALPAPGQQLPLSAPPLVPAMPATGETPEAQPGEAQVLVVEDNADVRAYLRSCLADRYALLEAANGQEGLALAQAEVPDLIVSDVMMPQLDGLGFLRALREDPRTDHIPVLMLTALAEGPSRLQSYQAGADDYLPKPFQREELRVRVGRLLASRQHWQAKFSAEGAPTTEGAPADPRQAFLQQLDAIVEAHLDDDALDTEALGRALGLSRTQLHRKVKAITGLPPATYVRQQRMRAAQHLLRHTDLNVNEVGFKVGYADPAHFARVYGQQFGQTPSESRGSAQES